MMRPISIGAAISLCALLGACAPRGGYGNDGQSYGYYQGRSCSDGGHCDRDYSEPGPRGGPGNNWDPPGQRGGNGQYDYRRYDDRRSDDRRDDYRRDDDRR